LCTHPILYKYYMYRYITYRIQGGRARPAQELTSTYTWVLNVRQIYHDSPMWYRTVKDPDSPMWYRTVVKTTKPDSPKWYQRWLVRHRLRFAKTQWYLLSRRQLTWRHTRWHPSTESNTDKGHQSCPEITSKAVTRPQYMLPNTDCSFVPKQDLDKVIKYYQQKWGYARKQSIIDNGQYLSQMNISQCWLRR
jgi:hypothetical protein